MVGITIDGVHSNINIMALAGELIINAAVIMGRILRSCEKGGLSIQAAAEGSEDYGGRTKDDM